MDKKEYVNESGVKQLMAKLKGYSLDKLAKAEASVAEAKDYLEDVAEDAAYLRQWGIHTREVESAVANYMEEHGYKGSNLATAVFMDDGTSVAAEILALKKKTSTITASVTIPNNKLYQKGSGEVEISLVIGNALVDSESVEISEVRVNSTKVGTTIDAGEYATFSFNISDTTTFNVEVDAGGLTYKSTQKVTFVYPTYVFFSATADYSSVVLSGTADLQASLNYNKTFNNGTGNEAYLWVASPYTPTTVQSNDGMVINIAGSVKGTKDNLTYWRSDDALSSGDWKLIIKS